jgi:hypothetical protein
VQYDLTASNIFNSRDTIAAILSPQEAGGALRLAPDNKIYWSCIWENGIQFSYPYADTMYHTENMNLSVINDPDVVGSGCNFSLYSFYLGGKRCYWGLPNNPDYSLGPAWGSVCDSLTNEMDEIIRANNYFSISPNPANTQTNILIDKKEFSTQSILLSDCFGKTLKMFAIRNGLDQFQINTAELPPGVYLVSLIIDDKNIQTKRITILH